MANYIEVDERDLNGLLEAVEQAITRTSESDPPLCELLKEREQALLAHLNNEMFGAGIASDVSVVLASIGKKEPEDGQG